MTYKVVVIDDKPLIRQSLIQTINWEKLGCVVAGEAENGLEAREIIDRTKPELVISDIKMPGLDGLALSEYVKCVLPMSQIIIITGYQEFEYAQRALSLGVCDLILKPIDNSKMEESIKKALDLLQQLQKREVELKNSQKERQKQLLSDIIKNRKNAIDICNEEEERGLLGYSYTFVYSHVRCYEQEKENRIKNHILQSMEHYERTGGFAVMELTAAREMVLAVLDKGKKSARERKISLKVCLQEINRCIQAEYGIPCFFVISRTTKDIHLVSSCCQEALDMLHSQYFFNEESILFMDSHTFQPIPESGLILQELDEFYRDLEHLDEQDMQQKAAAMIEKIANGTNGNEFRVKCLLSEICITLIRHYRKEISKERIANSTNEILEEINGLTDIRSVKSYLLRFIHEMKQCVGQKNRNLHPLAAGATDYIWNHFRENITLTQVAEAMGANASYLSRLLKQETGKNFVDILTEYRISLAKRLLEQPRSRVIEVCEQVGYSDYTYFYQVFKKVEGISPSEYKKNGKKT